MKIPMSKKGFTLIEMLIVIAIIGILASIVLVGLGPVQRNARDARRASDIRQIQTLLELCFSKAGSYPADLSNITGAGGCSGSNSPLPKDPTTQSDYGYTGGSATYVLGAKLEDSSSNLLKNDIDSGTAGSIACDDSQNGYCVGI